LGTHLLDGLACFGGEFAGVLQEPHCRLGYPSPPVFRFVVGEHVESNGIQNRAVVIELGGRPSG